MPKIYHWRNLFSAQGRYARGEFWGTAIGLLLFNMLAAFVAILLPGVLKIVLVPILIATFVASVNNMTKRLHDHGRSGWWQLIPQFFIWVGNLMSLGGDETAPLTALCALVGAGIIIIYLGCMPGQKAANRFGPPKSDSAADRGDLPEPA